MLEKEFEKLYMKFRSIYCKNLFDNANSNKDNLSATEAYCAEVIYLLNRPTIHVFADYINISQPNATYKINCLIKKGYVRKILSEEDKREYYLEVTDKYMEFYGANNYFHEKLMKDIRETFTEDEVKLIESLIVKIVENMN